MRKAVILILAMVVALSALPVTFACYNGGWGNWNWFWKPYKPVYCCPTYCQLGFFSVSADDNEDTFTEPKDVGETTAYINYCTKKQLVITIDNAYPGYEGIVDFCVKNTGTMPATITGITPDNPNAGYLQLNLTGACQVGAVIQPCSTKCGRLVISGIPQLEDAQNRTFTFTINIDYLCLYVPKTCETAYAYYPGYAACFIDLGFVRWGWTNGPLPAGYYEFPIYAGAAQCDLSKGENIGTLTVNYDGSTATVTYDIAGSGYTMTETHLYVGNSPIPPNNKPGVPGQYPYSHDLNNATTDQYTVPASGNIYIIAHAVACW